MKKIYYSLALLILGVFLYVLYGQSTLATFRFQELYGVYGPPQTVCMAYTGPLANKSNTALFAPDGVTQVPFQQLTDGRICFPLTLPASTPSLLYLRGASDAINTTNNTMGFGSMGPSWPVTNSLMYFEDTASGCGLTSGQTYFNASRSFVTDIENSAGFKSTIGGTIITLTNTGCTGASIKPTAFLADGTLDTLTMPANHLFNGATIKFIGTCPTGMVSSGSTCDATVTYYVINANTNTIQLSLTPGGSPVDIGNLTTGLNKVIVDESYVLKDSTPSNAVVTNPVISDNSNSGYIQVTNGLVGARLAKISAPTRWDNVSCTVTSTAGYTVACDTVTPHGLTAGVSKVGISGGQRVGYQDVGPSTVGTAATTPTNHTFTIAGIGFRSTGTTTDNTVVNKDMSVGPIQGLLDPGGVWYDTSGSHLYMPGVYTDGARVGGGSEFNLFASHIVAYNVGVLESGPLLKTYILTYTTNRPQYVASTGYLLGSGNVAGTGFIRFIVTVFANQQNIRVAYASDGNYATYLNLYPDWPSSKFDTRQWRSGGTPDSDASNYLSSGYYGPLTVTGASLAAPCVITSVSHGLSHYNNAHVFTTGIGGNTAANVSNKTITVIDNDHFSLDGTDCSAGSPYTSGGIVKAYIGSAHSTNTTFTEDIDLTKQISVGAGYNSNTRGTMALWANIAAQNGHLQYIYNAAASSSATMIGIAAGRASQNIKAGYAFTGFYTSNAGIMTGSTEGGIFLQTEPCPSDYPTGGISCTADQPTYVGNQYREIEIVLGTKADVAAINPKAPNTTIQAIQNVADGINLTHFYGCPYAPCSFNGYAVAFSDPAGGWKPPQMSPTPYDAIRSQYQSDSAFRDKVNGSDTTPDGVSIQAMWLLDTAASIDSAIQSGRNYTFDFLSTMTSLDGIFDNFYAASGGMNYTNPYSMTIATALVEPNITTPLKTEIKAQVSFIVSTTYDQDFIPTLTFYGGAQPGLTQNQQDQIALTKQKFATIFPGQPVMALQQNTLIADIQSTLNIAINGYGAPISSPYYSGTTEPGVAAALAQEKLNGVNPNMTFPTLSPFCGFFQNILTPAEPRFGNPRMNPSIGDGPTTWAGQVGLCIGLFDGIDNTVSTAASATWYIQAPVDPTSLFPYPTFFGSGMISVDLNKTPSALAMTTINYPGYYSMLRQRLGTADETTVMCLNGEQFYDHAHVGQDMSTHIYFLGLPFSLDIFPFFHTPDVFGAFTHPMSVVKDSDLGQAYNADNPPIDTPGAWGFKTQTELLSFPNSSRACQQDVKSGSGIVWTRCLTLTNGNAAYPFLYISDTFSDSSTKTMSLFTLWDEGPISTPGGAVTPTLRGTTCGSTTPSALPSGGTSNPQSTGWQNWNILGPKYPSAGGGNGITSDIWSSLNSGAYNMLGSFGMIGTSTPNVSCTPNGDAYSFANKQSSSATTTVSGTSIKMTLGTTYTWRAGHTAVLAGISGAGSPNGFATVTAVSGGDVTFGGLTGITGSYTGGTASPDFREIQSILRFNSDGPFNTIIGPYHKNAPPTRVLSQPGACVQVVTTSPVSTTECFKDEYDFTDGTKKVATTYTTSSITANNITVGGAPSEMACASSSACTWTVTGMNTALATVDLSAFGGTWYPDSPILKTGTNQFALANAGAAQPITHTIHFSTTPVANLRTPTITINNQVSAAYALLYINGSAVGLMTCSSSLCKINTLLIAPGTYSMVYQPLNGSLATLGNSGPLTLVIE